MPVQHGRVVPGQGWYDTDYLGIDQGPILAMIENWRSELVWRTLRDNPHIVRGLTRAGFTGGWLDDAGTGDEGRGRAGLACVLLAGCRARATATRTTIRFWAMGREGEVVQELVREFEARNPDLRVDVQQMPWTAAHEKLLTAFVGRATPDVSQLGNTWVCEFVALGALAPLDDRVAASRVIHAADHFAGIWATNVLDGTLYGVPWYVDTRLLFYRRDLLAAAGHAEPPATWDDWRARDDRRRPQGRRRAPTASCCP